MDILDSLITADCIDNKERKQSILWIDSKIGTKTNEGQLKWVQNILDNGHIQETNYFTEISESKLFYNCEMSNVYFQVTILLGELFDKLGGEYISRTNKNEIL